MHDVIVSAWTLYLILLIVVAATGSTAGTTGNGGLSDGATAGLAIAAVVAAVIAFIVIVVIICICKKGQHHYTLCLHEQIDKHTDLSKANNLGVLIVNHSITLTLSNTCCISFIVITSC